MSTSKKNSVILSWIFIPVILLLAAEVLTRMFYTPEFIPEEFYMKTTPNYSYGYDDLSLFYKKNSRYHIWRTEYWNVHKRTLPLEKEENEFRIFMFGGCNMHVNMMDELLEDMLDSAGLDMKFTVINMAYDGYGMKRIARLLKKALEYQPDMVLLQITWDNICEDEDRYTEYIKQASISQEMLYKSRFLCLIKKLEKMYFSGDTTIKKEEEKLMAQDVLAGQRNVLRELLKEEFRKIDPPFPSNKDFRNDNESESRKVYLMGEIKKYTKRFIDTAQENGLPVIAIMPAWYPSPAAPADEHLFESKPPIPEVNIMLRSVMGSKKGVTVFETSKVLFQNIDHFYNKYLVIPSISVTWSKRSNLIALKEIAGSIIYEILEKKATEGEVSLAEIEDKYMSREPGALYWIDPYYLFLMVRFYDRYHDKDILDAFKYYIKKNRDILPDMQRIPSIRVGRQMNFSVWLKLLKRWVGAREKERAPGIYQEREQ